MCVCVCMCVCVRVCVLEVAYDMCVYAVHVGVCKYMGVLHVYARVYAGTCKGMWHVVSC